MMEVPEMVGRRRLLSGIGLVLLVTACDQGAEQPGRGTEGISADEAKRKGVFAADGDAKITSGRVTASGGSAIASATVENISGVPEQYRLVVLVDEAELGEIDLQVRANSAKDVELDLGAVPAGARVELRLDGERLGEAVASMDLTAP